MVAYFLLYDRSNMGVGGVHCQYEYGSGPGNGWARDIAAIKVAFVAANILL